MQEINQNIAKHLKQQRQQKNWSLDRTANETGVSKAMLGQIERGESSPTITTLWKIATGFQLSLSSLIESSKEQNDSTVIRPVLEQHKYLADDKAPAPAIFPYDDRFGFEMFEFILEPGVERLSDPHRSGVTEHVIVISGTMELLIDGQWLTLASGEAIRFSADQSHGYRNLSEQAAVFHNIIHYAKVVSEV
ncbi:helix-turn-helix domain-containing protein [Amphritea sp. 1_MG-2023]|uniref:helix-turn-helix domain-containing protein n=1 Tax=Amphritea sp. 1_MG-2023 TaxID=3062670 RepID=UPI0026E2F321|nr:helix-turn-helix domain-containing protein [Amphritea sp. 1_MG-2023]MDO6561800.1 helix-turn-helix domain-containing protein [Amphritea sp. 1_MG-2023]